MYSAAKYSVLRVTHKILKHISVHTNKMAGFMFNALWKLWKYHYKEIRKHGSSVKAASEKNPPQNPTAWQAPIFSLLSVGIMPLKAVNQCP